MAKPSQQACAGGARASQGEFLAPCIFLLAFVT